MRPTKRQRLLPGILLIVGSVIALTGFTGPAPLAAALRGGVPEPVGLVLFGTGLLAILRLSGGRQRTSGGERW